MFVDVVVVVAGALDLSATFVESRRRRVGHVIEPIDNGGPQVHGAVVDDDQVNVKVDGTVFEPEEPLSRGASRPAG
ncbi:MAG TPA: hypothetical protein VNO33_20525 [Kofleriaceae bacterium]|nr:hypothetical protein [Kofleriaceae bacterium]